jgi:four helix bundle protein
MQQENQEENIILKLTFQLALDVIKYTELLDSLRKYLMSKQLFKSGTSIGAHAREAQGAESRADFIHKMKGGHKEAEETLYWLQLCKESPSYPDPGNLIPDTDRVKTIIGKIIVSSKNGTSPH